MTPPSSPHPHPLSSPTLAIRTDRALIRAQASSRRWLLVTLGAPDAPPRAERLPVNVALVLDRSGSMDGAGKFDLAQAAVEQALRLLRPDDRFALVVYDDRVDVVAPSTLATPEAKRRALDALRAVQPRGSTDLCAGWMHGCEQVAGHLARDGVSRALLLTDGLANRGTTDPGTLVRHAGELRRRGIATSTFGVGDDFDERLLRDLAHEGGGNFYYVQTAAQIPDYLTSELGEALEVTMRDAALHLVLPRGAHAEPLNRFRHTRVHGDGELRIELGDLVSGQELAVVVELRFPRGEEGERAEVRVSLGSDGELLTRAEGVVEWTWASHADNDRQPRDREVDREVATLYAARARAEATEANRHGDYDAARRVLERTARRILGYAGSDAALQALAAALHGELPRYADAPMSAPMLKESLYAAEAVSKSRSLDNRARRRPVR